MIKPLFVLILIFVLMSVSCIQGYIASRDKETAGYFSQIEGLC